MKEKLVKIKFRDKTSVTVDIAQAEQIMNSQQQVIMIYDENGEWTGRSINKSEIVGTDRDFYEEKRRGNGGQTNLEEPAISEEKRRELLRKYKPNFDEKV